ncbi:MAG: DUF6618 family protein [Candidatus Fimenecus sp.]
MSFKIQSSYEAHILFEASVAINGTSYLVIYGEHVNGNFCCVPDHGWGCEMADPSDVFYNSRNLVNCGAPETVAPYIAQSIKAKAEELKATEKNSVTEQIDRALMEQLKADTEKRTTGDKSLFRFDF